MVQSGLHQCQWEKSEVGVYGGPDVSESGLVLALDAGNSKSYFGYWSPNLSNGANAFDGSLSTLAGILGGSFGPYTYTFTKPPAIISARMYVTLGASSGQVGSTTNVFLVNGIDVTQKAKNANLYYPTSGWIDVTVESGSNWNTFQFTGTSGSTNPGIAAIEVNGNILVGNYSGTTWTDLSGNGNTGTLVNGVGYNSGNGGSLVFDGVDDYTLLTSNPFTNSLPNFSISVWFNKSSDGILLGNHRHGYIWESVWTDTSSFIVNGSNGTGNREILNFSTVPSNVWNNLTFINNSSSSFMKVFHNSVEIASKTVSVIPWNSPVIPTIGGQLYPDIGVIEPISGRISNTQIYNRALTASEVQQNFNATRSRFGI